MKTVSVTAGAAADFSTDILIGDVEAQTRWSLGALAATTLSKSALPLLVALTATSLRAFESPLLNVNDSDIVAQNPDVVLERGAGMTKSRPVVISSPVIAPVEGGVTLDGDPVDLGAADAQMAFLASLVISAQPSFSLLGLLNKLESYLDTLPAGWLLLIDQNSEKMYLFESGNATLAGALDAAGDPVAAFTLTADQTSEVIPGFGWE